MSLLRNGKYYDALHAFMVRDVEYWRWLAGPSPRRVLELACGTGRVAIPLARDGHDVVGVDIEPSMIEAARRKAGSLPARFEQADMRDFTCAPVDLVIVPFNGTRLLLDRKDFTRCMTCVKRALRPEGRFAIDVTMPRPDQLVDELPPATYHHRDPLTGAAITATHVRRYDRFLQRITLDATFTFEDGTQVREQLEQRVYFPQELVGLLEQAGFRLVERYGDYDRAPLAAGSPQLLFVAARR
jgi:SAM-dependent methyltransferase